MLWQMGFQDLDTGTNKGSLNLVMAVSVKDDEEKLRGKRGYILLEEIGSFPNILGLYNTLRPGVEEGDIVFGLTIVQTARLNDGFIRAPVGWGSHWAGRNAVFGSQ